MEGMTMDATMTTTEASGGGCYVVEGRALRVGDCLVSRLLSALPTPIDDPEPLPPPTPETPPLPPPSPVPVPSLPGAGESPAYDRTL